MSISQMNGNYLYSERFELTDDGIGSDYYKHDGYFTVQIEPFPCSEVMNSNCFAMVQFKEKDKTN